MKTTFFARRAAILALRCGFLTFGLFAAWIMIGGIRSALSLDGSAIPWWMYVLSIVGCVSVAILLLGLSMEAEDELDRLEDDYKDVPVRKINRRHSA